MLGTLNEIQINNVLSSQVIGRLACTDGKQPYIVPVIYTYDGKYIYGQTNEGAKLKILQKNPNICFEVDMLTNMRNWQSVVVTGKFEALSDTQAKAARDILFDRVFPLKTGSTIHKHQHESPGKPDDSNRVKKVMYRIKIENITGRFERE
jgi:uncharacterized protein